MIEKMNDDNRIICRVRLKEGVLDPQGTTILHALKQLGYDSVDDVRSGRIFELSFNSDFKGDIREKSEEICRKLLANPVIEEFEILSE